MKYTLITGIAAIALLVGCASFQKQVQKNISQPHPKDHRLGHVLFNMTPSVYPELQQASAPVQQAIPHLRRSAESEERAGDATPLHSVLLPTPKTQEKFTPAAPDTAQSKPVQDGLDIAEVPRPTAGAPAIKMNSTSTPGLLATAQRLVGIQGDDYRGSGFLIHLLQENGVNFQAQATENFVKAFYQNLNAKDRVYGPNHDPQPGDLVFFHNTYDRDKDGRADDWFSSAGVVVRRDGNGTIHFISYARGQVRRMVMSLDRPAIRRNESANQTLNSLLREKKLSDRPFTSYLAGELFAAYAALKK